MTPEAQARRALKRERLKLERDTKLLAMRSEGLSCQNCKHYGRIPVGFSNHACDLKSDHEGYVLTKQDALCVEHSGALSSEERS